MNEVIAEFVIPMQPITKKNSMRVIRCGKYNRILPSLAYEKYEAESSEYIRMRIWRGKDPISVPVNVKAVYYMRTRNRVDLTNLHEGLHDMLVTAGMLSDDSYHYVVSTDGSYVDYDNQNPRTEVVITRVEQRFEDGKLWQPREKSSATNGSRTISKQKK